jgi:hypothetical protein
MEARESLTSWWRSLAHAPEAATSRQRMAVAIATVLTAITRWLALARTPWDWDEILFQLAMQHYDVAQHRPHPPGFPLFILAADAIRAATGCSEFHALQAINLAAAIAVVPAAYVFCRELRMRADASLIAALLLAFAPNVWFFGGGAFSDVPSMTLVMIAIALLLRGCRSDRSLLAGAVLTGVAAGVRPQNLLIAFAPFAIAASHPWRRGTWRIVVIAALVLAMIVAISFGGAAAVTGFGAYRAALSSHQHYITSVDSFRSPSRPPLWRVADDFFFWPYRALPINIALTLLAAIALVRRRPPVIAALAAFAPFCLFAWLILDFHSASRFSIGYAPLIAVLAADGLSAFRDARLRYGAAAALVALMFAWMFAPLRAVHDTASPPLAAIDWIRTHVDSRRAVTIVDAELVPYAALYLDDYATIFVAGRGGTTWGDAYRRGVLLYEGAGANDGGVVFHRDRTHLATVARDRYFDVAVTPLRENVDFRDGWTPSRTMSGHARIALPPLPHATLEIAFDVEPGAAPSTIVLTLNGAVLETLPATARNVTRRYVVTPRTDVENELAIDSGGATLRLRSLSWLPQL